MTDSQKAAQEIYRWFGSEECETLINSDLAECEHEKALRTPEEVDEVCIERIRQIIDRHLC